MKIFFFLASLKDLNELFSEFKFKDLKGDRSVRIHVIDLDPYGSAVPFLDAVI